MRNRASAVFSPAARFLRSSWRRYTSLAVRYSSFTAWTDEEWAVAAELSSENTWNSAMTAAGGAEAESEASSS